jgi:molybdopterin/thiamine biosynthesis adenylyltransferase
LFANATSSPSRGALQSANALIVGVGALGCAATSALAGTGIGRLTLIDDDRIEPANLQRQILFDETTLGERKVEAAALALAAAAPGCEVTALVDRVTQENADRYLDGCSIVVDATDDPQAKYLLNRTAIKRRIPLVYGGVARTGGMAMLVDPRRSACLQCAFPLSPHTEQDVGCDRMGILAPVAGVIGSLQAHLALRSLLNDRSAAGTLFVYDLRGPHWRELEFARDRDCPACVDAATRAA